MIAIASGSPSVPARIADSGLPPTATQTGSGSCTGRGWTTTFSSGARCFPDQVTGPDARSASSSPSFSAKSSS